MSTSETAAERTPDITISFSKTVEEDPSIRHARLRRECPVALQRSDSGGPLQNGWLVTRYDDIMAVVKDTETFGQSIRWPGQRRPPLESNPPEHREFRGLMQPFFMPAALAKLEPLSRDIARTLIEPLVAAGGGDFAAGLARPLPPQVLLARMGQPIEDWERVKECCEAAYLQASNDADDLMTYEAANAYLWQYSRDAVADRKTHPRDPKDDIIAALLAGTVGGEPVDEGLIVGMVRLVLAAGHDSTTSAVGICLRYLAEHQDVQDRLRAEPALIPGAVEEILRLQAPVIQMPRRVEKDTCLAGRDLLQGDRVLLVFASGNRDEAAFDDPDAFVIDRFPNRHMSFGVGIHTCIGNGLARQEMKVALEALLARTRRFTLGEAPAFEFWHPYGATSLMIELEAA